MQTKTFSGKLFLTVFATLFLLVQSCKKIETSTQEQGGVTSDKKGGNGGGNGGGGNPPPPPPPPFYFTNCNSNPMYSATLVKGVAANVPITKNYVNSPGGSYPAFTTSINGVTISAPAGTFNVGSGSVTFTATGTPVSTGSFHVWIGVGNIQQCMMFFLVVNPPASGPTVDPGPAEGSTGVINFTYRGQPVAYTTVRAGDGKIWLQQNLGSPQVAMAVWDEASFGDYFQWGRWDDGHQIPNASTIPGGPSLLNPSHIPSGNPNVIGGTTISTQWWNSGGTSANTWSGSSATSTNGKDPCVALGPGWRMPTSADWANLKNFDDLDGALAAYMSNLKLPAAGLRYANSGGYVYGTGESYYWSSTASGTNAIGLFISDNTYLATLQASYRGDGYNCRCVKD